MQRSKSFVNLALVALVLVGSVPAHATDDPGDNPSNSSDPNPPPRSSGDPGNNPSGGGGTPGPRPLSKAAAAGNIRVAVYKAGDKIKLCRFCTKP